MTMCSIRQPFPSKYDEWVKKDVVVKMKNQLLLSLFLSATFFVFGQTAFAHGVHADEATGNAVIVKVQYHGDEPMMYAEVKVYSPDDKKTEYMNCRTDRRGSFAFVPNQKGEWTYTVNDGMGHGVSKKITVTDDFSIEEPASGGLNLVQKILVSLCVAWGAAGTALYWKSRRKGQAR